MKVTAERIPQAQMELVVELEDDRVQKSLDQAARRLSQRLRIPGFRKGKAPRRVIEQMIGIDAVYEEATERLVPQALQEAIEQEGLEPSALPQIEMTGRDPLTFKATVPLQPDVQVGEYRAVSLAKPEPDFSDEQVEEQLLDLRRRHAILEPVEREPQFNDRLTADIKAEAEGETIIEQEGAEFSLREGGPLIAPGFSELVVGLARDEEHHLTLDVAEDWEDERTAGKTLDITLAIHDVKEEDLPDADDDFAIEVSEEFETYDALRERFADNLRADAERRADEQFQRDVLAAVIQGATLEYPPALVEHELEHRRQDFARQMGQDPAAFLRGGSEQEENLLAAFRTQATEGVISQLVIEAIADAEGIEVTDAEVEAELEQALEGLPQERRIQLSADEAIRPGMRARMRRERAIERLEQIALANHLAGGADDAAAESDDGET